VLCRLRDYLMDMRAHMPPPHRALLACMEGSGSGARLRALCGGGSSGSSTGGPVQASASTVAGGNGSGSSSGGGSLQQGAGGGGVKGVVQAHSAEARDAYNECIEELEKFRWACTPCTPPRSAHR
jgi:indoleamine 2,3-dioxygenase